LLIASIVAVARRLRSMSILFLCRFETRLRTEFLDAGTANTTTTTATRKAAIPIPTTALVGSPNSSTPGGSSAGLKDIKR
jgi:hypothetical protein